MKLLTENTKENLYDLALGKDLKEDTKISRNREKNW